MRSPAWLAVLAASLTAFHEGVVALDQAPDVAGDSDPKVDESAAAPAEPQADVDEKAPVEADDGDDKKDEKVDTKDDSDKKDGDDSKKEDDVAKSYEDSDKADKKADDETDKPDEKGDSEDWKPEPNPMLPTPRKPLTDSVGDEALKSMENMGRQKKIAVALGIIGLLSVVGPRSWVRFFLSLVGSFVGGLLVSACYVLFKLPPQSHLYADAVSELMAGKGLHLNAQGLHDPHAAAYGIWCAVFILGMMRWYFKWECALCEVVDEVHVPRARVPLLDATV